MSSQTNVSGAIAVSQFVQPKPFSETNTIIGLMQVNVMRVKEFTALPNAGQGVQPTMLVSRSLTVLKVLTVMHSRAHLTTGIHGSTPTTV